MLSLIKHFHHLYRSGVLLILLMGGGLLLPGIGVPVLADTPVMQGTIVAGSLSESASSSYSFSGTLGSTTTLSMPFSVSDLTGSRNGWNLTITSTQFATSGRTHTLPTTASTITGVNAVCTTAGTCSQATLTNGVTSPVALPAGIASPNAVKFFGTANGTGSGVYTITPIISVALPAGALLGTYKTTFTLTVASGP